MIHLVRIKDVPIQNRMDKVEELLTHTFLKIGIPDGVRHDKAAESKERRNDLEHLGVTGFRQIAIPESPEQRLEIAFQATGPLQRKEEIVHREARHVVSRISPLSPRSVEQDKISAFTKEDVPGMKITMDLP
jgi:hypothetical protein